MKGVWVLEDFGKYDSHSSSGLLCPDFYMREVNFYLLKPLSFGAFIVYSYTLSFLTCATTSHTVRKPHVRVVGPVLFRIEGSHGNVLLSLAHILCPLHHIYNNLLCLTFLFPYV